MSEVNSLVLCGMKQAAHQPMIPINVAEGPAAESCNLDNPLISITESLSIFPENPLYNVFVLEMFIVRRAYRRTTGKAGLFLIRKAECNLVIFHGHLIVSLNVETWK